jgi:sporulation protein YlmC with PRC-barrel domain
MESVADKETTSLIAASKVTGTDVYNSADDPVGTVYELMIDKRSGNIAYAVISFGGFLGMGSDHYPLPWKALKYDTRLEGYVTDLTPAQLEGAPAFGKDAPPSWDGEYQGRLEDFYSADRYIGIMP